MQQKGFREALTAFADRESDVIFDGRNVVLSVNDDLIEAGVSIDAGEIAIDEGDGLIPASTWIMERLARLPILAKRLQEFVPETDHFVSQAGTLLPSLEGAAQGGPETASDVVGCLLNQVEEARPMETSVLYLTSDAGEGKTSVICEASRIQAERFIKKQTSTLIVPIPLGGRNFQRFDDITVGVLQNRYRFPYLYYESFLILVRLGFIVPAYDGFEEMFVESSSGEALSAMGMLIGLLDSQGTIVVAARKAYFEFENLRSTERMYDSFPGEFVGFAKLEIDRWGREQFLQYCQNRSISDSENIFNRSVEALGSEHSLLTRPVLVRRLVDQVTESKSIDRFLQKIKDSGPDFLSVFVRSIIAREANEKWTTRSGDLAESLLSVEQHCSLLSLIAAQMWEDGTNYLKIPNLEFVSEYFCEEEGVSALVAQQVRDRLKGHALLVPSSDVAGAIEFDHVEFRFFFLGEALAKDVRGFDDKARGESLAKLRKGQLPENAKNAFARAVIRSQEIDRRDVAEFFVNLSSLDIRGSYTHENCGNLAVRLLNEVDGRDFCISGLSFGVDSLRHCQLMNLRFEDCVFYSTSLEASELVNVSFVDCEFQRLRIFAQTTFENVLIEGCEIECVSDSEREVDLWNPIEIGKFLHRRGIHGIEIDQSDASEQEVATDEEIELVEKLVRCFMRTTHLSEGVFMMRFGKGADQDGIAIAEMFLRDGVLKEIQNRGAGNQRRFALKKPLRDINSALEIADGSYGRFLEELRRSDE